MARKKILWLCSWYPNRTDPFDGDFIQRHARAAALYHDIQVIRVVADSALAPGVVETERTDQAHLSEQIIYLGKGKGLMGRFLFTGAGTACLSRLSKNILPNRDLHPLFMCMYLTRLEEWLYGYNKKSGGHMW